MKKRNLSFICIILVLLLTVSAIPDFNSRSSKNQTTSDYRAIHMGGLWGQNETGIKKLPQEYFEFVKTINANWIGISVGLTIESSLDSTVESRSDLTFTDEDLLNAIKAFKRNGINVYVTLAFEKMPQNDPNYPVARWQLGDPNMHNEDANISAENWPWRVDHPGHATYVKKFWETYTEQAMHYSAIAEEGGATLFSLGTETDRLFRSRAGGGWPNDFGDELKAMVDSVRTVFTGLISYDMEKGALTDAGFYGPGSAYLWQDLGLDVIGISAYFQLVDFSPATVISVPDLEISWRSVFQNYLVPLANSNPGKPILFLEFGYVDDVESPFMPSINEFQQFQFTDNNNNSLDDGQETQAHIYEAFFNVNEENNNLVKGAFLWGNDLCAAEDWANSFGQMKTFAIRQKLAEIKVKEKYASYTSLPSGPVPLLPADNSADLDARVDFSWEPVNAAASYQVQISIQSDFSTTVVDSAGISLPETKFSNLEYNTQFYWRVRATNAAGDGDWSSVFSFTTKDITGVTKTEEQPNEYKLQQNYPNPFNMSCIIEYFLPEASFVELMVYSVSGEEVAVLFSGQKGKGDQRFYFDAEGLAGGVYFYRIQAGNFSDTKKMLLIK